METLIQWISSHAQYAHWVIFGTILLAGMNVPICVDFLVLCGAMIAAAVMPEHTLHLYLAVFLGCYLSAWIAYWIGRLLGRRLLGYRWFSRFLPLERLSKIQRFYEKYGLLTLLIGRFIPFGVRNCIFMTTGMSRMHFGRFALFDLVASFVWSTTLFYVFYTIGHHYETVVSYFKTFNLLIFSAFGVTLIALIWYKRRKKTNALNV